ncbi:hypothetical protein HY256_08235, partial [Candidatus Sumerlaeota bacterium]|nr:hypothetical protein [Candidatus Sumerlaeota bacterium]
LESVEGELKEALAELNTLKGKRWVRWGLDLFSLNTPDRWIAAVGALLIGLALIPVFWVSDRLGGSSEPPR